MSSDTGIETESKRGCSQLFYLRLRLLYAEPVPSLLSETVVTDSVERHGAKFLVSSVVLTILLYVVPLVIPLGIL